MVLLENYYKMKQEVYDRLISFDDSPELLRLYDNLFDLEYRLLVLGMLPGQVIIEP